VVVVRAQDVDAVFGGSISRALAHASASSSSRDDDDDDASTTRRAVDVAKVLAAAKGTGGRKATKTVLPARRAIEVASGAKLADAVDALVRDGGFVDAAKDNLARRFEDKFCETYADECDMVAGDAIDRFDDAASAVAEELKGNPKFAPLTAREDDDNFLRVVEGTDAYARKREELKDVVLGKLDDEFLASQLQLLARQTARHLRTGLKNLRISKSMTKQTQTLLADADAYFVSKAQAAFGSRPWKAKQKDVYDALDDYVNERLQVARLQGTYLPDNDSGAKIWPFPINFAFHWLLPSALGLREQQSRGLSATDRKNFNIVDDKVTRFPIPGQISQFAKNLVSPASTGTPVE